MSSRDEILRSVRRRPPSPADPPAPFTDGIVFDDPVSQFADVLAAVGGRCAQVSSMNGAKEVVSGIARDVGAHTICSRMEGVDVGTFNLAGISDPHHVDDVDLTVMPGQLAVAENAAVWVTAASPVERALLFLSQHLVLVVPCQEMLSNLHQAYERIDVAATAFGIWISGPSKTADIEQSLVMGAHGPRSLTVILVKDD